MSGTLPNCPACKLATLTTIRVTQRVRASDGVELTYEDEMFSCTTCGEAFYTPDQSLASSRTRAGALRAHDGLLTPVQIRQIRESYGLSQAQFEKTLGLGAKTVVRWERGSVCQGRAVDNLLVIARDYPGVFRTMAERNGVDVAPIATEPQLGQRREASTPNWTFSRRYLTLPMSTGRARPRKYGRLQVQAVREHPPKHSVFEAA